MGKITFCYNHLLTFSLSHVDTDTDAHTHTAVDHTKVGSALENNTLIIAAIVLIIIITRCTVVIVIRSAAVHGFNEMQHEPCS